MLAVLAGPNVECRTDGAKLPVGNRAAYVGNATIEDIDTAEAIMLIGTNPRVESPVINARLRKAWSRGANVGLIGPKVDLTFDYAHLGKSPETMTDLLERDHSEVGDKPSLIIVGQGALMRKDGEAVLANALALAESTKSKLMILHTAAGRVGAMDVGAVTEGGLEAALDGADVIYNLGTDEGDIPAGPFVIYQGSRSSLISDNVLTHLGIR